MGLIGYPSGNIKLDVYSPSLENLEKYIPEFLHDLKKFEKEYESFPEKQIGNYKVSKLEILNNGYNQKFKRSIKCLLWHPPKGYNQIKQKLLTMAEDLNKERFKNSLIVEIEKMWKAEYFPVDASYKI